MAGSKKFRGKPCAYCGAPATGPDHVIGRGFFIPKENIGRLAQPLPNDPTTGAPQKLHDVSTRPANDSGGAGGVSSAADYYRFTQMMLNGGWLDDAQILSRTTIGLMTSDSLGPQVARAMQPSEVTMGSAGLSNGGGSSRVTVSGGGNGGRRG